MKLDIVRYAPPGIDLRQEKGFFITGLIGATLYSLVFLLRYYQARTNLYEWQGGKRVLIPDYPMVDFAQLIDKALVGFLALSLCMLALIVYHYAYYHRGSKSIYLMRRLPDSTLLHRQCLTLPLGAIALCLISAALLLLIYYVIYMAFTPEICLTPGQWQKIWGS